MNTSADDREIFSRSLIDVLEQMTFIFADEAEDEQSCQPPEDSLLARMEFSGEKNGWVSLAAPGDLCREIAVNMLGASAEDLSASMIMDALREVLNMTCGRFLTERFGLEPVFDLTVPKVSRLDEAGWQEAVSEDSIRLCAEDFPLLANLEVE